ncbi:MAG: tRNA (adenosine(37)-N6)-dimethylallyltransferase MiaA [Oligoflexus sp.]
MTANHPIQGQHQQKNFRYVVIAGPTASGKSSLAHDLALACGAEIINCDSVQLYQGLDIGAAKPSKKERAEVPYHLLDRLQYADSYDARKFAEEAEQIIDDIRGRNRLPIVVGGTGLYLRALWQENWHDLPKDESLRAELDNLSNAELYQELQLKDAERATKIHSNDRYRLLRAVELLRLMNGPIFGCKAVQASTRHEAFAIKMEWPRSQLHQRIAQRTKQMLEQGLVLEVEQLLEAGWPTDAKPLQSIGYRQVLDYFSDRISKTELEEKIIFATRQYAKRQETWFRKVHFDFYWHPHNQVGELIKLFKSESLDKFLR